MPMEYPTDDDIENLVHVEFSYPGLWDPTADDDDDNDEWSDACDDEPDTLNYDEFLDYRKCLDCW